MDDGPAERHFSSRDQGIAGFKARYNLAVVYAEQKRWQDAEAQLHVAVSEAPLYAPCWSLLGEVLLRQGRLQAARQLAERMLQRPELKCSGLLLNAEAAIADGATSAARTHLQLAVQNHQDDHKALNAWCEFLFEHGPHDEAERALLRLTELDEYDGAAFHNLGTLYMRGGRLADAARAYERSLRVRPRASHTCRQLSEVYRALGRPEDARRVANEAVSSVDTRFS